MCSEILRFDGLRALLIGDDDALSGSIQRELEESGVEVLAANSVLQAMLRFGGSGIDVVFCDVRPPGCGHLELIRKITARFPNTAVFLLAAPGDRALVRDGLAQGAFDFMSKPLRAGDLQHGIDRYLRWRDLRGPAERLHAPIAGRPLADLDEGVADRADIAGWNMESFLVLAKVAEFNDHENANHLLRVSRYAATIASALGLSARDVGQIALAAPLHDIGKVAIDQRILRRRGALTAEERVEMKQHTVLGAEILGEAESLVKAKQVAHYHHEAFDGSGYPDGLSGAAIPLEARITAVADVFDALTTRRCYKAAWPVEDGIDYLWRQGARQFDLEVVAAFSEAEEEVRSIHTELKDAAHGSLLEHAWSHLRADDSLGLRDSVGIS